MLTSIFNTGSFSIESVVLSLCTALVLGVLISLLYRYITVEKSGFQIVLGAMPAMISAVIMIVNGNLGASVAVLGAFGLVRFRSAQGTAWEIGFLFYAMAAGLACGMGFLLLAAMITLVVGVFLLLYFCLGFKNAEDGILLLKITIPEDLNYRGEFDDIFLRYTKRSELTSVRTSGMGTVYELSYLVALRDRGQDKEMIDAIRCRNGNLSIVLMQAPQEKKSL